MGILDFFNNNNLKTAEQRKKKTEKLLKSLDIPFIDHLPLIEEENEVKIRTAKEIAERILILVYLGYFSEVPHKKDQVIEFLVKYSLWNKVSKNEKKLFQKDELTEQDVIDISWRSEAVWVLLWTIKRIDKLDLPTEPVEISEIVSRIPRLFADPKDFIQRSIIRPTNEILDFSDLIYRLHWATRNAGLNEQPMPANLNSSVVIERHYAINWVTFYADNWDEITTDT